MASKRTDGAGLVDDGRMTGPDWAAFWSLNAAIGEVVKRGAPKLGDTVRRGSREYVCTDIRTTGHIVLTPIPDGMTAMDLGRKFEAARLEKW